jgi:CBS domain-containing protein
MEDTLARDIMSTDLITLKESDTLEEALKALLNHRITGLLVVDAKGKLLGVLSEFDVIQQLARHKKLKPEVFREKIQYSKNPETVPESATLTEIMDRFLNAKFRRVPVLAKDKKLVRIITRRDLMRIFFYRAKLSG